MENIEDETFNFDDLPLEHRYNYLLKQIKDLNERNTKLIEVNTEINNKINELRTKYTKSDEKLMVKIGALEQRLYNRDNHSDEDKIKSLAELVRDKALHSITNLIGILPNKITKEAVVKSANNFKEFCKQHNL